MKFKLLVISLCCFIQLEHSAQLNNSLLVKSTDSTNFYIFINGFLQHLKPYHNIKITGYDESKLNLKIIIADSSNQSISKQIYFEKKDKETSSELTLIDSIYKFRFNGEVNIGVQPIDTSQLIIAYHTTKINYDSINPLDTDSIFIKDSISVKQVYLGEKGCSNPIEDNSEIINLINEEIFSSNKIKTAKILIEESCLSVSDIIEIINLFEFDDQKLEIALDSFYNLYDIENYFRIKNYLLLNSSKDSFQNFLDEK